MKDIADLEPQLANCRDYWLGWGAAGRSDGDLSHYRSGLANPLLNGVLRLRDSDDIEKSLALAADRLAGVPWMWWVAPDSAADTADRLVERGGVKLGAMPVMAVRLDRLAPLEGPSDLSVQTVEGADGLAEWVETYAPNFDFGRTVTDGALRVEAGRPDTSQIVRFVARVGGRAVGTALLFDAHDVAGVYVVATAPDHRGRGIGAMLSAAALEEGRRRGLRFGTLQASGPGAPVYARMGFETVAEYQLFQPPAS